MSERISLGEAPVTGFGQAAIVAPVVAQSSGWTLALATSVMGAATGWALEELAEHVREKRRGR